jgi:hypothetical protein
VHMDSLRKSFCFFMISDLHCEVDENCTFLGYNAVSSGSSLLMV